jgi:catechol 2,3-dioxygenase-like lactoylglutathione lyase family enzyme
MAKAVPPVLPSVLLWIQALPLTSLVDMPATFSHDHVGISVTPEDLDATIQWYASKLGFVLDQRFDSHGTTFAFIVSGDVKIELLAGASNRREARTDNVFASMNPERLHHFCLAVEDLDTTVSQLRDSDVPLIGGPMEVPAIGQRIAFITDNLGNIIELAEPGTWRSRRQN